MPDSDQIAAEKNASGNLENPAYGPDVTTQYQDDPNRVDDPTTQPPMSPIGRTFFDTDQES